MKKIILKDPHNSSRMFSFFSHSFEEESDLKHHRERNIMKSGNTMPMLISVSYRYRFVEAW